MFIYFLKNCFQFPQGAQIEEEAVRIFVEFQRVESAIKGKLKPEFFSPKLIVKPVIRQIRDENSYFVLFNTSKVSLHYK